MQTWVLPDIVLTMNEATFSFKNNCVYVCVCVCVVLIANKKKLELSSKNYNFGKLVSGNSELIASQY